MTINTNLLLKISRVFIHCFPAIYLVIFYFHVTMKLSRQSSAYIANNFEVTIVLSYSGVVIVIDKQ